MQKKAAKTIKTWIKVILVAYLVVGVALYFLQDRILFHPQPFPPGYQYDFPAPHHEINLAVNQQKNLNIIRFTVPDSICRGVVLYFHGNRKNIGRYASYATNFTRQHYEVWMVDYPGFGKSTGRLSEKVLYDDAAIVYRMARARFSKDSILLYGRSLGSGIAAQLASVKDCKRLILETPYYSLHSLMRHYAFIYPVSWMAKYHLPTYRHLEKVEVPVTVFHGSSDEVIPYSQSRKLRQKFPRIELVEIPNGRHNNLDDSPIYHRRLDSLLALP